MPGTDLFNNYVEDTREGIDLGKALDKRKADLDLMSAGDAAKETEIPVAPPGPSVEDFGASEPTKKYWNPSGGISSKPVLGPAISTLGKGPLEAVPSHAAAKYTMSGKRIGTVEETSLFDTARKSLESLPGLGEQALGGLVQFTGDTGLAGAVDAPGAESEDLNWQAQVTGQELFRKGQEDVQATLPDVEPGSLKAHIYGAVQSVALSGTALTASVLTGGTMPLIALGAFSGAQEYGAQRQGGSDVPTALLGAVVNGLAEYWGERLPFEAFMKSPGFFEKAIKGALFDTVGELGTQTVQSAVQRLTYQPGMTWDDFGTTMKDVFIQSLMAGGFQGVTIGGAQAAITKSDIGPTDFKGYVEQNFPGSQVELGNGEAIVTLPTGRRVEIVTPQSERSKPLMKEVAATLSPEMLKAAKSGQAQIQGVYFKVGDTAMTENDLIFLTGMGTDLTTLPHEKGHLIVNAMSNLLTPQELEAIGLPVEGVIDTATEEAVMEEFEQYAYKRAPSPENPLSPLDKAFQKVIDFAHEVYSAFGGETQRTTFEKMRKGEVFTREGAPRAQGETAIQYQRRTQEPPWFKPITKTKSGRIVGAPASHPDMASYNSVVRKIFNIASDMDEANPGYGDWYDEGFGKRVRQIYGLYKDEKGEWHGNIKGANDFMKALAMWSPRMPYQRNAQTAIDALFLQAEGKAPEIAGAVSGAEKMGRRFEAAQAAPEFGHELEGVGPKVDSFFWDLHNGTYQVQDLRNATIDTHIIQAMGLKDEKGNLLESLPATKYAWARQVIEDATKMFNEAHGKTISARTLQALVWEWNRAGQVAGKVGDNMGWAKYFPMGVVAGEIIPSTSSDLAPWIHEAAPATRKAGSDHVAQRVLFDEEGNNRILSLLKVPQGGTTPGVGTWEGAVNPNFTSSFLLPQGLDTRLQNLYADIWGYVFTQDSVVRMTPDVSLDGNPEALQATLIERVNGAPIPESLIPSLIEYIKGKVNTEITLDRGKILALNLRDSETGKPYTGIDDSEYHQKVTEAANEWAKKNKVGQLDSFTFGTQTELREGGRGAEGRWDARLYLERISAEGSPDILAGANDLRKAALEAWKEFSQEVAPPGAKLQARKYTIRDMDGKDVTPAIAAVAQSESRMVNSIGPHDRVWLLPNGRAVFLEDEWGEIHEGRLNTWATKAGVVGVPHIRLHQGGAALGAVRFHGTQAWSFQTQGELALEIYGPLSDKQKEIIRVSVGARKLAIADITNPQTGDVYTYAQGRGDEFLKNLKNAMSKAYGGVKFQEKTVHTSHGEFPLDYNGWKFEGQWPGAPFYQYTNKNQASPSFGATIMVGDPESLAAKTEATDRKFSGGPVLQARPTLYSAAELVVEQKFPTTVNINEVMPLLKKYGIKDAEISDLHILGVVGDGKRVSKADLLDHIRASQIQVKEVMHGVNAYVMPKGFSVRREADGRWTAWGPDGELGKFDNLAEAQEYVGSDSPESYRAMTKFGEYVLPGGENYGELLLTVPMKDPPGAAALRDAIRDAREEGRQHDQIDLLGKLHEIEAAAHGKQFASSHWDEPNVLAHIRFNDRTGPGGERLLHVEEFQSDWASAARKKEGLDPLATSLMQGQPPMPFSGDWKELVAKRMIIYAAQNGYDGVTWVTGQQTADRYNLANHISAVYTHFGGDGLYSVTAINKAGDPIDALPAEMSADELPKWVGKTLAEKIVSFHDSSPNTGTTRPEGQFRGLDLMIGGEWAVALYDQKFVSIFNKLAKKWGGKVGTILIGDTSKGMVAMEMYNNRWQLLTPSGQFVAGPYDTRQDALDAKIVMNAVSEETIVHHLALPEQMKRDVSTQGLPMYQARTPGPKGMTVNFADQKTVEMGEELMRSVFAKVARVQTNDESVRLAQEMISSGKMNLETFLQHDPNTGWPDTAHAVAADMIAGGVFDYVQSQLKEAKAGRITKEQGLEALFMGMTATASWYGPASETARILQARQIVTTPEQIPVTDFMKEQYDFNRQMAEMIDKGLIGQDELIDAATQFYSMDQLASFRKRVVKSKEPSILNQLFYFSLLSNPVTQAANIVGNLGPVFFAIGEQYLSEKMPFGATPKGGANGMAAGLYHGLLDAITLSSRAIVTGEGSFGGGKYDTGTTAPTGISTIDQAREELNRIKSDKTHPFNNPSDPGYAAARRDVMLLHRKAWNPISGDRLNRLTNGKLDANGYLGRTLDVLGEMVSGPFKGLSGTDEFFKVIAYRMSIWGRAYQMGAAQGLEGEAFNDFVARFVDDPPSADHEIAMEFARKQTFTNEPGKIGQAMMAMTREYPALRLVVPFVSVISNIGRYNLERMPVANLLLRSVREDISAGGKARDMALAKTAVGAAIAGSFAVLAGMGMMTGSGPSDPQKKKLWIQQGWQEYSFKIGKDYYSYKRLEPFATPLGVVADVVEMARFAPDFDIDEGALVAALSFIRNFTSKTYMDGVSKLLDTVVGGGESTLVSGAARWAKATARILVPGGIAQVAKVTDPVKRDVQTWRDAIMERIPGLSRSLMPARNLKGEAITVGMYETIPGKLFGMVNPVYYTSEKGDPVSQAILSNRMKLTMPSRSIGGGQDPNKPQLEEGSPSIPLTPEQYDWLVRMAGNELKDPDTGLGAWDTLRRIVTNQIPVGEEDGKAVYFRNYSKGPEGGQAFIIQKVIGDFRSAARRMLEGGEPFPELGEKFVQKKERRGRQLMPRVGQ